MSQLDWDSYFISLLPVVASKSRDPRTKVSVIAVGKKNEILGTGYNDFPCGVTNNIERYEDRETKYKFIVHAEQNLISFAARNGVSLDRCKVYLPFFSCSTCSKLLIQAGVSEIIIDGKDLEAKLEHWKSWHEDIEISKIMLQEAKVDIRIIR